LPDAIGRYYNTIWAFNQGHIIQSVSAWSDGVRIDSTPPLAGFATNGKNLSGNIVWTPDGHVAEAVWDGFYDPESLVVEYYLSVGGFDKLGKRSDEKYLRRSFMGCGDGSGFFDHKPSVLCNKTAFARHDMEMAHLDQFWVTVESVNGAHDVNATQTTTVTVDKTPPALQFIGDGTATPGEDRRFFSSTDGTFAANWAFSEPESGLRDIRWTVLEEVVAGIFVQVREPMLKPIALCPLAFFGTWPQLASHSARLRSVVNSSSALVILELR